MKIARLIASIILGITLLCLYSSMVLYTGLGGKKLGIFTKPIYNFSYFPIWIKGVLTSNEFVGIPPSYIYYPKPFDEINRLTYNLYITNAFWDTNKNGWIIKLINLRNNQVIYEWFIDEEKVDFSYHRQFPNCKASHALLASEKSLIVHLDFSPYMMKLDSNSNIVWLNKSHVFHHSTNYGPNGNIWIPASDIGIHPYQLPISRYVRNLNKDVIGFTEDYILSIDAVNGNILYQKGVAELLIENDMQGLIYGFNFDDPIHLNDIQPVFNDSKYWKKGDLFLSCRNRNAILHFRPSTNKLINVLSGPFIQQHDIDIINDSCISIFNNNTINEFQYPKNTEKETELTDLPIDSLISSQIIIHNFNSLKFSRYLQPIFEEENIFTETDGLVEWLSNGDVVIESQDEGKLYVISSQGKIIYKKQFRTEIKEYVHLLTWIHVYEDLNML